jgi:hypothetical protein
VVRIYDQHQYPLFMRASGRRVLSYCADGADRENVLAAANLQKPASHFSSLERRFPGTLFAGLAAPECFLD